MGMTMSQKILAAHAGLSEVKAGQLIEAKLDMVLGNDVTSPVAINVFEENGATTLHLIKISRQQHRLNRFAHLQTNMISKTTEM